MSSQAAAGKVTFFQIWNWKSALWSALCRCPIFFFTTIRHGWRAALGAAGAELWFRFLASGFFGAITQALSRVRLSWAMAAFFVIGLPLLGHVLEWLVHWARGTPNLKAGVAGSVAMTIVATLFNWYAMRRGALRTGPGGQSFAADLRSIPGLIAGFLAIGPVTVWRAIQGKRSRPAGA